MKKRTIKKRKLFRVSIAAVIVITFLICVCPVVNNDNAVANDLCWWYVADLYCCFHCVPFAIQGFTDCYVCGCYCFVGGQCAIA